MRNNLKAVRRRDRNGIMRTVYVKKSPLRKMKFGTMESNGDVKNLYDWIK